MGWTAQWRTKDHFSDSVLVLDEAGVVREAHSASQPVLSRLLTQMGDIETWKGDTPLEADDLNAEGWGQLVIARESSGQVIEVEPELFWQGIYQWFRARGVDYDSDRFDESFEGDDAPVMRRSSPMDD